MTKEELIHITLKQLSESLKTTPENFKLEDPGSGYTGGNSFPGPTIIWQFKVQVDENKYLPDPLNSTKTIIVSFNKIANSLTCLIYSREVNNFNHAVAADTSATINYEHLPLFCFRTYRQFTNLKRSLIKRKNDKEFMDYMKKLGQIFPGTHEDDLFK